MKNSPERIFFVYTAPSSFVRTDMKLLNKYFPVLDVRYQAGKTLYVNFMSQFKLLFRLLFNLKNIKAYFVWFADYHSILPVLFSRIFKKKSLLVLGGYDVTYLPELGYGSFSNPLRKFCASYSIKNATDVLGVAPSIVEEAQNRVGKWKGRFHYIPTGFDAEKWYRDGKKEELILTVGLCNNYQRYKIKGIDLFIEIARLLPEFSFLAIGLKDPVLSSLRLPENFKSDSDLSFEELRRIFSRAKIYAQLSLREGLPSAVCEAMLCECIPVGTDISGNRIVIGDKGFILKNRDPEHAAVVFRKAIALGDSTGLEARERIKNHFSVEKREKSILSILK